MSDTVELDEILRSFDPETRADVPGLDADAGAGDLRPRAGTSTTRSATSAPFAEDTATIVDILNRQEDAVSQLVANTGIVFQALTERDDQLRSLIENSNTVFATTAARDAELQASFRALPTFERESRITLERLTEFADETDPLSRSCARRRASSRRRSQDLEDIAPDLKNLLEELQPLIDASVTRLPGRRAGARGRAPAARAARSGDRAAHAGGRLHRPLQARARRRSSPTPSAATQAKDPGTTLHYLRTSNPFNPENLAVYPQPAADQPAEPVPAAGRLRRACRGLPVYEDRQCRAANLVPSIDEHAAADRRRPDRVPTAVPTVVPRGRAVPFRRSRCRRSRRCR